MDAPWSWLFLLLLFALPFIAIKVYRQLSGNFAPVGPSMFEKMCRKYYGFLVSEYGFSECAVWADRNEFEKTYKSDAVVVRIFKGYEGHVDVALCQVEHGPDLTGVLSLEDLLARRQPEESLLDSVGNQVNMPLKKKLRHYALALRSHAGDVLSGDSTLFR